MIKKIVCYILICFLPMFLLVVDSNAQEITVVAEKDSVAEGEPVQLFFDIKHPKSTLVLSPQYKTGDTLQVDNEVEVYIMMPADTIDSEFVHLKQSMIITAWKAGEVVIPPFKFVAKSKETTDTILTNAIKLLVGVDIKSLPIDQARKEQNGLVTVVDEKTKDFNYIKYMREIYPLMFMDYPLYTFGDFINDFYWIFILAILLIAAAVYAYFYYKKYKQNLPEIIIEKTIEPAHVIAFRQLVTLKEEKLWQKGEVKKYYTQLCDILREYIENRYQINALEMTTEDIIKVMEYRGETKSSVIEGMKSVLNLSDYVKFAKLIPQIDDHIDSYDKVELFVRNTQLTVAANGAESTNSTPEYVVEPNKEEIK